jgi:hypothetical protein
MIIAKEAITEQEKQEVFKALPVLKPTQGIHVYGYWKDNKCVGASWLDIEYPHYLSMEYYDKSSSIVKAIADSFKELFKIKHCLTAKVTNDNFKSLKMIKQLGFYVVYKTDTYHLVEITKDTWNFKNRYPL